jgi:hypothetical protein
MIFLQYKFHYFFHCRYFCCYTRTAYGREYQIKAELNQNSEGGVKGIKVKNCFAFSKKNSSYSLIDDNGCSTDGIVSKFMLSKDGMSAVSMVASMFKFPEGAELHLQCDIILCDGECDNIESCSNRDASSSFTKTSQNAGPTENIILAATTAFVLDPSEVYKSAALCDYTGFRPNWLLWLAIILGVLFLIMLLMNLFLCTAMSCSCARTEITEKEPSIIEEYDVSNRFSFLLKYLLKLNSLTALSKLPRQSIWIEIFVAQRNEGLHKWRVHNTKSFEFRPLCHSPFTPK